MADDEVVDLPFAAEYAKSARASCKECKASIAKETLRLAVMVQAPKFDGKMPNWFHYACFWGRNRVRTTADIKDFDKLRWEDQEKIRNKIVPHGTGGIQANVEAGDASLKDFTVEVAQNARRTCKGCQEKFAKGQVIIAKKDYESDSARRFGPQDMWHHVPCFVKRRDEFEFYANGSVLPGFKSLTADEQQEVEGKLPAMRVLGLKRAAEDAIDSVKRKKHPTADSEEVMLKKQNKIVYDFRDQLHKQLQLSKKNLQYLLEYNNQEIPPGESRLLDNIAECMTFGALLPCPECKNGQLTFGSGGYKCHGNLSEWTKCSYVTKNPKTRPFKIPEELKEEYEFLKNYKYVERVRIYSSNEEKPSVKSKDEKESSKLPLSGLSFSIIGETKVERPEIKKRLEKLGARVVIKMEKSTTAVIASQDEVDQSTRKILNAKELNVHVVSEDFLAKVESAKTVDVAKLIKESSICPWGADLSDKLKAHSEAKKSSGKETPSKSGSSMAKVTVKGKSSVDPDSGLEGKAHVLEEKDNIYSVVLGMVDVRRGTNSYYRLQILEADKAKRYWVFRSWGRIGTKIGGAKCEKMEDKASAKENFLQLYEEKTGNQWSQRKNFVKRPSCFYPIDVDYGDDDNAHQKLQSSIPSKLIKPVQDLITMILDIETMKKALLEFEIDLSKMPLGKLSRKQVHTAYGILTELQEFIKESGSEFKFLDASNRFYTLIPHDFGFQKPPLLNNEEILKSKIEMLDNLLEIELAYNLLKDEGGPSDVNPIDANYAKLNTKIEILDKVSEEHKLLSKYTVNTHAATHNQYSLKIEEIFRIERKGEASRFKPFRKLSNRCLLWHGSRITNFAGILSQGLRIAPPEAPSTGYMFGKGLYFADLVSKSANYCFATKENPYGILLLCEVALGNMHELKNADFIKKLPTGKHSTKGVGSTQPDPSEVHTTKDGVVIPCGKPVKSNVDKTSLLYNEYIVYDVAQVHIKYLLKVKFDWKF